MSEKLLYLAGPITGQTYGQTTDWRAYVSERLPKHIKAVSPMRGKEYLATQASMPDVVEDKPLSSAKGIACRDRYDTTRCDMLIVNFLGAKKVSIGSVMEVAWADAKRTPIILVMEPDNIHGHGMLKEVAGFIVRTLDEAIHIANTVLTPSL